MIKKIKYSTDQEPRYYYWVDDALVGPYDTAEKALDKFISHISTCTEYDEPNIKYKLLDSAVVLADEMDRKTIKNQVVNEEYDSVLKEKEELHRRYDKLQKEYDKVVFNNTGLEDELEEIKTQHGMSRTCLEDECGRHMRTRQKYEEKRKEFDSLLQCHQEVIENYEVENTALGVKHASLVDKITQLRERYE